MRRPVRRLTLGLAAAITSAALAACASQISPDTVAAANGRVGAGAVAGDSGSGTSSGDTGGADASTGEADGTSTADDGSSGSSTTSSSSDSSGDKAPAASGAGAADGGVTAGTCDGFKNQTGITDKTITLGNVADISGPVPGLFQIAQDSVKAFVAYYNATNPDGLCGRTLVLKSYDSRGDASGDQQAYANACADTFAVVGSVSAQDQGGAATADKCGIPDIRGFTVTSDRRDCGSCFSSYALAPNLVPSSNADYWKKANPEAAQHIGMFYVNVPAAKQNAESAVAAYKKAGLGVDVVQGIDTGEFNYSVYAQQIKDKGVQFVQYYGPYQFSIRLQKAMEQQGVKVPVYFEDATIYDQHYVDEAGSAGEGTYVYTTTDLLDNTKNPEMALYRAWLERVSPGSAPNFYGVFAWSAARLFVQEATKLGGGLTRPSLVSSVSKVRDWTGNGIHTSADVGEKITPKCTRIIQLKGGSWRQVSPGDYVCGSLIDSGVGG
ncbi:ABC transporter substrate-binding protein [Nocardioides acrostichi]|uniref:ABC transporter substrate-binding protein n=1 Tax=Nocardioides acrostichi TaxID=2784339 RepID=A0A930V1C4_9ACTN|nr:ABC transporter substrate-binding protein [Nocardioides acrostichi]MBF4162239.1 ABC transporter substrate-binding protein [Nocardioides acrostichi]